MKPRERVLLALDHREPDRIPIDLGGTICSSIHVQAYIDLKRYLGMELEPLRLVDYVQQLPYLDEALLERFGVDFRMVQLPAATAPEVEIFQEGEYEAFYDRWGSKLRKPKRGGLYFDWVEFPIREASLEALEAYRWPPLDPPEQLAELRRQAEYLYHHTDYALVGSAIIGGGIFEQPARIMGLESFLVALVTEPRFADRLMEQITDLYIESCNRYLDQVGEFLHVFAYWDDLCGQDGWLISPDLYRKMIKPKQRRLLEAIRKKTRAKVYFHSCGAVSELIPDLIDLGFDILNPVQVSARGMDTRRLKQEYGADIVFWGGGVDTQRVLPFGTPQQVRDEVRQRIEDLATGGGFVFAAVHNIQAGVPPENIVAAFEAALEYGKY
ncbi:MAG: uroporphyrinogen decarboxylase family protein [Chloroflexia bacterium]